jgi:acyl-coenzyme A thioesterase PaaI-like protein
MSDLPSNIPEHKAGFVLAGVPHAAALQLMVVELAAGEAVCKVPYAEHLVGNPDTRDPWRRHHGAIGQCMRHRRRIEDGLIGQIATLDLRIDYMKAANPGEDIFAFAECYKVTKNIAFARGVAYHTDRSDPIATCAAAFMLGTKSQRGANAPGAGGK